MASKKSKVRKLAKSGNKAAQNYLRSQKKTVPKPSTGGGSGGGSPYSASNPYTKPLSAGGQANVNAQVAAYNARTSGVSQYTAPIGPVRPTGVTSSLPGANSNRNISGWGFTVADINRQANAMVAANPTGVNRNVGGINITGSPFSTGGINTVGPVRLNAKLNIPDNFKGAYSDMSLNPEFFDKKDSPVIVPTTALTAKYGENYWQNPANVSAYTGATPTPTTTTTTPAPTVRNAVSAPTKSTTPTSTESTSEPSATIQSLSSPTGGAPLGGAPVGSGITSGSTGGGFGGGGGGTWGGSTGGSTPVGERITESQAAAQATAMALARSQVDQQGVNASPVGETVDLADLQAKRDAVRQMLDDYGPEAVTMPEFKSNIQALIASGVENLKKVKPTPPVPVVETQEQTDFIDGVDPFQQQDIRAFMDETRKALGMPELESQRIDVMQQLQVVQETYQKVIDQIKENPNLPKGLAARRLTEVFEDQKFAANALIAQLEVIDQQLEDGNSRLNQEMGIFQYQATQQEKQYQRRMDQFGFMLESGAIGAFTDKEMRDWSEATNIPIASIKKMREQAINPSTSYDVTYKQDEMTGDYYAFYTSKTNPLDTQKVLLGNVGVKTGSGGSTKVENVYTEEKDTPQQVKADFIATLKAHPDWSEQQMAAVFPELSADLVTSLYTSYGGTGGTSSGLPGGDGWLGKAADWWSSLFK